MVETAVEFLEQSNVEYVLARTSHGFEVNVGSESKVFAEGFTEEHDLLQDLQEMVDAADDENFFDR